MIKSMTGYGRADAVYNGRMIVVESKSVNHRFLEIFLRLPASLQPLEMEYRKIISEIIKRGRLEVAVKIDDPESNRRVNLNLDLAREYYNALNVLKQEFQLESTDLLRTLAGFRDIFTPPEDPALDADFLAVVKRTVVESVSALARMRQEEGISLYEDMVMRLRNISEMMRQIKVRAPLVVLEYQKRLAERVRDLTAGHALDEARLAQEVALMAERLDVTEEVVRMQSHLSQFEADRFSFAGNEPGNQYPRFQSGRCGNHTPGDRNEKRIRQIARTGAEY